MPPQIRGHQEDELAKLRPGQCFVQWKPGLQCPNDYEFVVENVISPGYMKCCQPHVEGFARLGAVGVKYWTREAWEESGREAELKQAIAEAKANV